MCRWRARSTRSSSMTEPAVSPLATIDLEDLGLDRGAHLLIQRALSKLPGGAHLGVRGRDPALSIHLRAWARARGHTYEGSPLPLGEGQAEGGAHVLTRGS